MCSAERCVHNVHKDNLITYPIKSRSPILRQLRLVSCIFFAYRDLHVSFWPRPSWKELGTFTVKHDSSKFRAIASSGCELPLRGERGAGGCLSRGAEFRTNEDLELRAARATRLCLDVIFTVHRGVHVHENDLLFSLYLKSDAPGVSKRKVMYPPHQGRYL